MQVQISDIRRRTFVVAFEHGPDYEVTYPEVGAFTLLFPKGDISLEIHPTSPVVSWKGNFNDFTYTEGEGMITFDLDLHDPSVEIGYFVQDEEVRINHFNAPLPKDEEEEGEKK